MTSIPVTPTRHAPNDRAPEANTTTVAPVRIAILGCGAVTARSHMPALRDVEGTVVTAVVDTELDRARTLADRFGVETACADYREILDSTDAVVLALPHHLHGPVGVELAQRGKHLLVEKPLALTLSECDSLVDAAAKQRVVLTVGHVRRYMPSYRGVRALLSDGLLGRIISFDVEEGSIYNWPVASDFFFRGDLAGGGVLMDAGAHVLDALGWWLGALTVSAYEDDCAGGVEADCTVELTNAEGAVGKVVLSRIRQLRNTAIITGTNATLEVSMTGNDVRLSSQNSSYQLVGETRDRFASDGELTTADLFRAQAQAWIRAIRGEPSDVVEGGEARDTVALIERCYATRRQVLQPWQRPPAVAYATG